MIIRIWKTGIINGHMSDYLKFAEKYSMPMFKQQENILGILVTSEENVSRVISLWPDSDSILRMEQSDIYKATVKKIMCGGFLCGEQTTEIFKSPIFFFNKEIVK